MGYQLFVGGTIAAKRITTDTSDDNDCKLKLSIDFSLMSARVAGGTHVSQSCFVPGEQRSIRRGDKADEDDKKQDEEEAKKKPAEEAKKKLVKDPRVGDTHGDAINDASFSPEEIRRILVAAAYVLAAAAVALQLWRMFHQ